MCDDVARSLIKTRQVFPRLMTGVFERHVIEMIFASSFSFVLPASAFWL